MIRSRDSDAKEMFHMVATQSLGVAHQDFGVPPKHKNLTLLIIGYV